MLAHAQTRLYLDVTPANISMGQQATVEVRLDANGESVGIAGVFLDFDETRLAFDSGAVNAAVFGNALFTSPPTEAEPGVVSFSAAANAPVTSDGVLVATLQFTGTADGVAPLAFLNAPPRDTTTQDLSFSEIPSATEDGAVIVGAAPARLYVSPASQMAGLGEIATVEVRLDANGQPVRLAGVFLDFDETRLNFVSGTTNAAVFNNGLFTSQPMEASPGVVSFSAAGTSDITGNGVLVATLQFTPTGAGSAALDFSLAPPRATGVQDAAFADLPLTTQSGEIIGGTGSFARVFVAPTSQAALTGEQVDVEVRLDANGLPAKLAGVFLDFDPALLKFNDGTVNAAVFNDVFFTGQPSESQPGVVSFSAASNATVTGNDVLVATLRFTALAEGTADLVCLTKDPERTQILDNNFTDIPTATSNGAVLIGPLGQARLFIAPSNQAADLGDPVLAEIRLDTNGEPARLASVFLEVDSRLRFETGTVNTSVFNDATFTSNPQENEPGIISFSAASTSNVAGNNVLVATLQFTAIGLGDAPLDFSLQAPRVTEVSDAAFNPLALQALSGLVEIEGSGSARLFVSPSARTVNIGESAAVEIRLDPNSQPVRTLGIFLDFDETLVQFDSGTVNATVFNNAIFTSAPMESEPGVISFSASANADVAQPNTLVATLQFTGLAEGVSPTDFLTVSPRETVVSDAGFNELMATLENGTITVGCPALSPPANVAATDGTLTGQVNVSWDAVPDATSYEIWRNTADDSGAATMIGTAPTSPFMDMPPAPWTNYFYWVVATSACDASGFGASDMGFALGANSARVFVEPAMQTVPESSPVSVEVRLDANGEPAQLVGVFLQFDLTVLSFDSGSINTSIFDDAGFTSAPTESEPGIVSFSAKSTSDVTSDDVLVATLQFTALAEGVSPLDYLTTAPRDTIVSSADFIEITSTTANGSVTVAGAAPTLLSITALDANPTNAATVNFEALFSEDVSGVDIADFSLFITGTLSGASIQSVSGSGDTYAIAVDTGMNNGTIRLDLADDDSIVDMIGQPLGGIGVGNGDFNAGDVYVIDKTAPTVAMSSTEPDPTTNSPIVVNVAFSEPVVGFQLGDIVTINATAGNLMGSGASYAFDLTPISEGLVAADIAAGVAADAAGNLNQAASQFTRMYSTCCPGDADLSGFVNGLDYSGVTQSFGESGPFGDADCSGFVNGLDYASVTQEFGQSCGSRRSSHSLRDMRRDAPLNANPTSFRLGLVSSSVFVGENVEVEVSVFIPAGEDGEPVRSAGVFLAFDDSRLRFEGGQVDGAIWDAPAYTAEPRETEPRVIAFPVGSSSVLPGGEFSVAILRFAAIAPGEASLEFLDQDQRITQALDAAFNPVATSLSSRTLLVKATEAGIVLR